MKSFLDLETTPAASISSFSLAGARVHVDDNYASFLLSPRSSVATSTYEYTVNMTDTATEAAVAAPGAATANTTTTTIATTSCSSTAVVSPAMSSAGSSSSGSSVAAGHHHSVQPNLLHHHHHHHHHHPRHQRFMDKLDDDDDSECHAHDELPLHSRRHRYQHSLRLLDNYLWPDQRPSSSPNHQPRSWSRSNSKSPVLQHAPKYLRVSSDELSPASDGLASSTTMTRDEFEALPPTIQRKVS